MEYISHEDFKGFMSKLQANTPKGILQEIHKLEHDGANEFHKLSADLEGSGMNEDLEKEGNAFTAGLAKAKKGEKFTVGGKTVKDTSNYDASIKEVEDEVDSKLAKIADLYKDKAIKHEEIEKIVKALTGQGHEVNVRYVQDFLNKHNVKLDEAPEGKAKVLGPVKGTSSTFTVQTPKGEVVDLDFDVEYGDKIDDHVYEGTLYAQDDEYQYILPVALIVGGGGSYKIEPYYKEFSAEPLGMQEASYTDNYEGSWGYREGYSPDSSDFEQAVAEELNALGDEDLTDEEYEKALEALENPKIVGKLWGVHPKKAAMALAKMVRGNEMEEGLNMPPLQPTGQTIVTNEDQAPFGFSVLSPDERKQLKEYINSVKTIKKEIAKLLEKAGKSGKIMEDSRQEEDEKVPAERKPEYHNPTKKSKPGGNRTNLVMTKAEMWEGEGHEHSLDSRLHDTFNKVTDLAMKQLVASGLDPMEAVSFLKDEIEKKAKEAMMSQYDF